MGRFYTKVLRGSRRSLNPVNMEMILLKPVNNDHGQLLRGACKTSLGLIFKTVNNLDCSDNAFVELGKVICWNPVSAMYTRTYGLDFIMSEVITKDLES